MTIEKDFLLMMPHKVKVKKLASTGYTQYGAKNFASTEIEYRARIVQKARLFRTEDGREVYTRGKIFLYGDPGITNQDQVKLPDGTTAEIVFIEHYPDDNGTHHEVLHYQ